MKLPKQWIEWYSKGCYICTWISSHHIRTIVKYVICIYSANICASLGTKFCSHNQAHPAIHPKPPNMRQQNLRWLVQSFSRPALPRLLDRSCRSSKVRVLWLMVFISVLSLHNLHWLKYDILHYVIKMQCY